MQFLYCCELLWAIAAIAAAETSANRVATAMPPAQEPLFLVGLPINQFLRAQLHPDRSGTHHPNEPKLSCGVGPGGEPV